MNTIKLKFALPDYKDLLQYGEIEYDHEFKTRRIRKIRYMGILYHLTTVNGELFSLKQWDCLPYDEDEDDIRQMSEDEMLNLFMLSDRDRKHNDKAEKVYWLCIYEINRRHPCCE